MDKNFGEQPIEKLDEVGLEESAIDREEKLGQSQKIEIKKKAFDLIKGQLDAIGEKKLKRISTNPETRDDGGQTFYAGGMGVTTNDGSTIYGIFDRLDEDYLILDKGEPGHLLGFPRTNEERTKIAKERIIKIPVEDVKEVFANPMTNL